MFFEVAFSVIVIFIHISIITDTEYIIISDNRRFLHAAQVCHEVIASLQLFTVTVSPVCNVVFQLTQPILLQGPALHLEFLASYITELSLLEYSLLCHVPSLIAASSIFLANFILKPTKNPWVYMLSTF